jgi:heme/copper-type cytochrome/quinol oxidase subunit 4
MQQKRTAAYRKSTIVFLALVALTVIEYYVAVLHVPFMTTLLILAAVAKAALVVYFFMHVSRLWSQGEEH